MDQTLSIRLRSGEISGQSKTFVATSLKTFLTCLDICHVARSCWNTLLPSGKAFCMSQVTLRLINLMKQAEVIIPSIGVNVPTPEKLAQLQNIFAGGISLFDQSVLNSTSLPH